MGRRRDTPDILYGDFRKRSLGVLQGQMYGATDEDRTHYSFVILLAKQTITRRTQMQQVRLVLAI